LFVALVADSLEALTLELVEADAVGLVGDEQVEHGPDEREAAVLAREADHDFGASFDLAERALEQVRAAPAAAVSRGVAQVRDERVQIISKTSGLVKLIY